MPRGWNEPLEEGWPSQDTVLLVGQAPLPSSLRAFSASGLLSLEIEVDRSSGVVVNVACRDLSPSAEALLGELLVGGELEAVWGKGVAALEERYFSATRGSLIRAMEAARHQFRRWKQETSQGRAGILSASDPEPEALDPAPSLSVHPSRKGTRHQLATLLVTLLANSRLLDGHEWSHRAGRPIPTEVRRQATQLYAVVHQILHSVQTEQGLLEPRIEPVSIPDLVQRALSRSAALGRQVPLEQRLPADLPAARGDPIVLEEALVLLFDEVAAYATLAGAGVEITAERRRPDLQVTIGLRDRQSEPGAATATGVDAGEPPHPLEQMWEGGLGTLAARTLVEHQGGRLWMKDSFPQDHHLLCLALPANGSQEEAEQSGPEMRGNPRAPSGKPARVTATWR